MTRNNICKVFFGAVIISMLLGGATRLTEKKMEEKAEAEKIILIAEEVPQPKEENQDTYIAFNELDDGDFIKA